MSKRVVHYDMNFKDKELTMFCGISWWESTGTLNKKAVICKRCLAILAKQAKLTTPKEEK